MFTPPQSPLPAPHDPLAAAGEALDSPAPAKQPTRSPPARIRRFIALVVPVLILVLISLTSRAARDSSVDHYSSAPAPHHLAHAHPRRHSPRAEDPADLLPTTTTTSADPENTAQQLGAGAAATAVPSIPNPAWPVPTPFPQPFDSSLSYNFSTTTCRSFFDSFTTNITFRACRPFSLLLGTSSGFFDMQSNLTELTAVIGGTCATPQSTDQCQTTMGWLAAEIVKPAVCGTEITAQNAMVLQALNGFKTYDLMRQAGCLVNQRSNAYCFVEAVASTSPVDVYFYALPIGTPVPQKATPSCSACVKSLMALYANHASDKTLPLSRVYSSAQKLSSNTCGVDYALAVSGASRRVTWPSLGLVFGLVSGIWTLFL